ncbi:MAG TPA: cytochrome c [Vicinamibacterales bacterium]|nr:cytochrome c [Vicinamibacterales bacterium]
MSRPFHVLTVLCGLALVPQLASAQDALAKKGQEVYTARKCTMCHSVAGKGNPRGSLDGVAGKRTAAELRQWIVNWKEMAAKHNATRKPPMPDYSKLPKEDVDALVAFLQTLK